MTEAGSYVVAAAEFHTDGPAKATMLVAQALLASVKALGPSEVAVLTAGHYVLLLMFRSFSFFRGLISKVAPLIVTTCSRVIQIYKIRSDICGPYRQNWAPKTPKLRQFRDLVANIEYLWNETPNGKRRCKLRSLPHLHT